MTFDLSPKFQSFSEKNCTLLIKFSVRPSLLVFAKIAISMLTCSDKKIYFSGKGNAQSDENYSTEVSNLLVTCIDFQKNGSLVYLVCGNITGKSANDQCQSIFTFLNIYGANMMPFANIIYLMVYTPVLLIYILIPGVCRRAYDKIVLSFILTQISISIVIISISHFMLCHKQIGRMATIWSGISLEALTIGSVLLLLVISYDVSLTITRFRWAPSSGTKGRDENHKFLVYALWILLGTFLPTSISAILQFSISDENILHPNFQKITIMNYRVIAHVATVPFLVAIASNVLFVYTTVKMINIQKSSSLANENRKASVKKKYILYLKLYLLMDAPYVTGALGSYNENLWFLKFVRVVQPIFLCYAIIPRDIITNLFLCKKKPENIKQNERRNVS